MSKILDKIRVIKFRAIIKSGSNKGKWAYGIPYKFRGVLYLLPLSNLFVSKEAGDLVFGDVYIVLEDTLGQYIGLRDVNNKEIYQGDIVKFHFHDHDDIGVVEWDKNGFYIVGKKDENVLLRPYSTKSIKIIGNVYESPKLLGGKK